MKQLLLIGCIFSLLQPIIAQNIGIGTSTPLGKLQINHRSTVSPGIILFDSANNSSGSLNFQNNGFIGRMSIRGFTSSNFNNGQYIDIRSDSQFIATFKGNGFTGIRNFDPAYPLDINGDMNTTGAFRINGDPGTSGQVLTSNGAADPVWRNTALTNNVRFAVSFDHTITTGNSLAPLSTLYNLSPTVTSIGANTITINRSGLYHFDIYFLVVLADTDQKCYINYYFSPSGGVLPEFVRDERMPIEDPVSNFTRKNFHFSVDVYLSAPSTISLGGYHVLCAGSTGSVVGKLYGHLISE